MAKQAGRLMLINIDDGAEPTSSFIALCGFRSKSLTLNANQIDVTTIPKTPADPVWRELTTGIRSVAISGSGYFEDDASEVRLNAVMNGTGTGTGGKAITTFQITIPDLGTYEGLFNIDSIEYGGEVEGDVTFTLALSSAGQITFTAPAP